MTNSPYKKKDALDLHLQESDIKVEADLDIQRFSRQIKIAEMLYAPRTTAGMTQQQLADAVGVKPQLISQLESADYEEHSLSILERIAEALDSHVEVRIVPNDPAPTAS